MKKSRVFPRASILIAALCLLGLTVGGSGDIKKEVTFNKDVAPIFFSKCAECHREGQTAPMSLLSYKEARPWARSIREKVLNREMPPWHADSRYGEFINDRRLSDQEISTIVNWVETGAKEGGIKDLPPAPKFGNSWGIGNPDLVLEIPQEVILNAEGTDEYHYFELPTDFAEDKYVRMAEVRPSNPRVAHHITAFIIPPMPWLAPNAKLTREQIEKIRAEMEKGSIFYYEGNLSRVKRNAPIYDDGCETPSGGGATSWDGSGQNWSSLATPLAIYSPGVNPVKFQTGSAKKIPAGSKIIIQAHYWKPEGKVERDRTRLGLIFVKEPPMRDVHTQLLINNYFLIPPGAEHHRVTACWTSDRDIELLSFMPHMHWRGDSARLEAFLPDGRSQVLLSVPRYDFSWQTAYYLSKPLSIPKGTRLVLTSFFNNSAKNRRNPDPAQAVRAGEPTNDEMMSCFVDYTVPTERLTAHGVSGASRK